MKSPKSAQGSELRARGKKAHSPQPTAQSRSSSEPPAPNPEPNFDRAPSPKPGATLDLMFHLALPLLLSNGHESISLEDCYLLTRQLHVLQKAGVPLLSGLAALQGQVPSKSLQRILGEVHQDLLEGRTFSQALGRHPKIFTPVFRGLIRVGEAGGLLDEVLLQLAQLLEWEIDLRNRLKEALQYPLIVLCTLCMALTIMVTFVLPRFAQMFRSFRIQLPWQTRLLVASSRFLSHDGWLIALLLVGAVVGWWLYLRTDAGRLRWHTWKLRLPVLGPVFLHLAISRFARVTAALIRSGVPMLETLALASESVNNRCIQHGLVNVCERIQGGETLAKALKTSQLFSPVVVQMVATGEETGHLDELLQSVSDYYDQQVNYLIKQLLRYVEPVLLIVVGAGVLLMATAVLVPMWDLVKVFKHTGG